MGQARKYILQCDYTRPSGVTTVSGVHTYDLRDAFSGTSVFDTSGTTFSYTAITTSQIATMSDSDYNQRVTDFISYMSVNEYSFSAQTLLDLINDAQFNSVFCLDPTTTTTTSTSTTTTTSAPIGTTTSTTTSTSTSTTTSTTVPPVTYASVCMQFNGFCYSGIEHLCFTSNLTGPLPVNMCITQANVDGFAAGMVGVASSHMCSSSIVYNAGASGACCIAPSCTTGDWFTPTPAICYYYVPGNPKICIPGATPSSWIPSACGDSNLFCCGANCVCLTVNFALNQPF